MAETNGPGWNFNRKDGVMALLLVAGLGGGLKLVDNHAEVDLREIGTMTTQITSLQEQVKAMNTTLAAMQSDRTRDLTAAGVAASELGGIRQQLIDLRDRIEQVDKRSTDADKDLHRGIEDLSRDVNAALRAPLVSGTRR